MGLNAKRWTAVRRLSVRSLTRVVSPSSAPCISSAEASGACNDLRVSIGDAWSILVALLGARPSERCADDLGAETNSPRSASQ